VAFDAGAIEAHLDIDTSAFDKKLAAEEAKVKAFETKPHNVRIAAVFDNASLSKAVKAFNDLDTQISRNAMARLRSSPQGSVLGALNALFSPHPVTGAPSASQSASGGLLGQIAGNSSSSGNATTAAANQRITRQVVTGGTTTGSSSTSTQNVKEQLSGKAVSAAGTVTQDVREQLVGGSVKPGAATENVTLKVTQASKDAVVKDTADTGDKAGKSFASGFGKSLGSLKSMIAAAIGGGLGALAGSGGSKTANPLDKGVLGGASSGVLGLSTKVTGAIGLGAAGLGAVPAAVAGVAGLGVLGGGAALALKSNAQLEASAKSTLADLTKTAETAASVLVKPLSAAFTQIDGFIKQIAPELKQLFAAAVPFLTPLLSGIESLVKGLLPGLVTLLKAAGPAVAVLAGFFGTLGSDIGKMFTIFAPVLKDSTVIFKALLDLVGAFLPIIATLAGQFASALGPAFVDFGKAIQALLPFLTVIGKIMGQLAGAVLGDFVSLFGALATLLESMAPGFQAVAKALSGVFTVLENTGVFAIIGDAIESIAKPLGTFISQLLQGLAPLLPPIIKLIGNLSTILAAGLAAAIISLLPSLTILATTVLKALADILPVVVPLLTELTKIFTGVVVQVVSSLATAFADLLKAIPPSVLQGIVIAIAGIVTAVKLWSIAQVILDAALSANPIGLFIIALVALGIGIAELVTHWSAVWGEVKKIFGDVVSFIVGDAKAMGTDLSGAWTAIENVAKSVWGAIESFFKSWWSQVTSEFHTAVSAVASFLSSSWSGIESTVKTVWDAIASFFSGWWSSIRTAFTTDVNAVKSLLSAAWSSVESTAKTIWGAITSFFSSFWSGLRSTFTTDVNAVKSLLSAAWSSIETTAKSIFNNTLSFFKTFWADLKSGFSAAVSGIGTAWNKIESIVKTPVDWVVKNVYDNVIVRFWNDVAGPVGLPKLSKLASGGKIPGYGGGDTVPALLEPGEAVIDKHKTAKWGWLFKAMGVPGFAAGGIIPDIGGAISGAWDSAVSGLGKLKGDLGTGVRDLTNGLLDPLESVGNSLINKLAGEVPGKAGITTVMKAYPKKLWDGLVSFVKSHVAPTGGSGGITGLDAKTSVSGSVASWLKQAIADTGVPSTWLSALEIIANGESGGNPNSINLSDSNAAAGDPSRGLMQTIMTTFEAYHQPGTSNDIYDPVARRDLGGRRRQLPGVRHGRPDQRADLRHGRLNRAQLPLRGEGARVGDAGRRRRRHG
jgi:phage-related protein